MKLEIGKPNVKEPWSLAYYGVGLVTEENEYWFQFLPTSEWYFGHQETWYDGPIKMFGFGFFELMWHYNMER